MTVTPPDEAVFRIRWSGAGGADQEVESGAHGVRVADDGKRRAIDQALGA
jgi:hypothetical protein